MIDYNIEKIRDCHTRNHGFCFVICTKATQHTVLHIGWLIFCLHKFMICQISLPGYRLLFLCCFFSCWLQSFHAQADFFLFAVKINNFCCDYLTYAQNI